MKDEQSRRQFLKWVGIAPAGVLLASELGCGGSGSRGVRDAGDAGRDVPPPDASNADTVASRPDASNSSADTGEVIPDVGADASSSDVGAGDAGDVGGEPDGGDTDAGICEPTGSDVEGPFHIDGAPNRTTLAGMDEPGERIVVEGTVSDCGTPIEGALLDVWHADANGAYDDSTTDYRLRGQMQTDADGKYRFETIKPGRYPLGGSTRPAHIHFIVSMPGFNPLTTQMYFDGDPFLSPNDPCGAGCNSGDPTLIVEFVEMADGTSHGTFDIVLTRPSD